MLTLFVGNLSLFNVIIAIIIVPRIIKDINSIMIIIILQIIIIEIVPIIIVKIIIFYYDNCYKGHNETNNCHNYY